MTTVKFGPTFTFDGRYYFIILRVFDSVTLLYAKIGAEESLKSPVHR